MDSFPREQAELRSPEAVPIFPALDDWSDDTSLPSGFEFNRWISECNVGTDISFNGGVSDHAAGLSLDLELMDPFNLDNLTPFWEPHANDIQEQHDTAPMILPLNNTFVHDDLEHSLSTVSHEATRMPVQSRVGTPKHVKRRQPRISEESKRILKEFYSHTPYPSAADYTKIARDAGVEERRARNWFTNTRSREPDPGMCPQRHLRTNFTQIGRAHV